MSDTREFIYLLNALESAASKPEPFKHNYGGRRKAVIEYVSTLRAVLSAAGIRQEASGEWTSACRRCDGTAKRQAWSGLGLTRFVPCFDCGSTGRIPVPLPAPGETKSGDGA